MTLKKITEIFNELSKSMPEETKVYGASAYCMGLVTSVEHELDHEEEEHILLIENVHS